MTTNELKVLSVIWDWGGEASLDIIARKAGVSANYARVLCQSLAGEGCIAFLHSKLCKLKSKGKLAVAERRSQNLYPVRNQRFSDGAKKIVIPQKPSKFGLDKNKRGGLILNYG